MNFAVPMDDWYVAYGTPSVSGGNGSATGIWMWSYSGNTGGEGIYACFNFQQNHTYRVCIDAVCTNTPGTIGYSTGTFYIQATNGDFTRPTNVNSQVIASSNYNSQTWQTLTYTFTPSAAYNKIWIYPYLQQWVASSNDQYMMQVDNIKVSEIFTPAITPSVSTISPSGSVTLSVTTTPTITPDGHWSWTPVSGITSANADSSVVTVSLASSCQTTIYVAAYVSACSACGQYTASAIVNVSGTNASISITPSSATVCAGQSTILTASGAATYTWGPGAGLSGTSGSTVLASPSASTQYTVFGITGACTGTATIDITLTPSPTITASASTIICSGSNALLSASGANTYTWMPAMSLNSGTGSHVAASPGVSTTYTVTGSSLQGCTGYTTVAVSVVPTPTLSALSSASYACAGDAVTLSASGATSYTWSSTTNANIGNSAVVTVTPTAYTIYTLNGENGIAPNSCQSTTTIALAYIPKAVAGVSSDRVICAGDHTYLVATGGTSYSWSPVSGLSSPHNSYTYASPLVSTVYTVSVSNNGQCPGTATVNITVNPLPQVNAGKDTTINIDETYQLTGTGDGTLGWLPINGIPLACNYCTQATVHPQASTCYVLEATNTFNCVNRDTICITVTKDWDVYIPNAFTPDGNGTNDIFIPVGYGLTGINLYIFDRWGQLIYKGNGSQPGWDGKNRGKLCEEGVYVYQVEIHTISGITVNRTGHVTLLSRVK